MKELKDIVLKQKDIVYFADGCEGIIDCGDDGYSVEDIYGRYINQIIKIERPVKYETIYEAPKQILTKEEKEYLEAVCKPFKDKVKFIKKCSYSREWIGIHIDDEYIDILFPYFEVGTMYKGMEPNKEYTLKELGLFE